MLNLNIQKYMIEAGASSLIDIQNSANRPMSVVQNVVRVPAEEYGSKFRTKLECYHFLLKSKI